MHYYRGHTASQTLRRLKDRFGLAIAPRTFETWLREYKPLTRGKPNIPVTRGNKGFGDSKTREMKEFSRYILHL